MKTTFKCFNFVPLVSKIGVVISQNYIFIDVLIKEMSFHETKCEQRIVGIHC